MTGSVKNVFVVFLNFDVNINFTMSYCNMFCTLFLCEFHLGIFVLNAAI